MRGLMTIQIQSKTTELDVKKFMKNKGVTFEMVNNTKKFYGIKDIKADEFCEIVENINDACMLRSLKSAVNDKQANTMISKYPQDYELWKLYEVDTKTGEAKNDIRKIANAEEYSEIQIN